MILILGTVCQGVIQNCKRHTGKSGTCRLPTYVILCFLKVCSSPCFLSLAHRLFVPPAAIGRSTPVIGRVTTSGPRQSPKSKLAPVAWKRAQLAAPFITWGLGIWGSRPRRIRAAYQFFLFTLFGSLIMLLGILYTVGAVPGK